MGIFNCIKSKKNKDRPIFTDESLTSGKQVMDNSSSSLPGYSSGLLTQKNGKIKSEISEADFEKIKLLGKGSFGKVLLVKKKSNDKLYAMKVLQKSIIVINNQEDHTKTERQILEKVKHPFIVSLHYAFQTQAKLYLVTEFMQGGELFYHLRKERRFDEEKAKFYICEIILALEFLHNQKCIYRDLKPENILLGADGHIKITDFGLSKLNIGGGNSDRAFTICGTPEYLAPEIILDKKGYGHTVDWWSLGVLFYDMLEGYSPFKNWNAQKQDNTGYDISIYLKKVHLPAYHSAESIDLVDRLITIDPKKRLGYKGSHEIKSHPFFKNINWDDVYNKRIKPPFVPLISNELDLGNFHSMFTEENIHEGTTSPRENIMKEKDKDTYEGFTYIKKSSMLD